ncbi:uncharacterized protein LOC129602581 [Paramacrobiotus metropolitanus]|uniref:uncharacterized protein LOC129602581 n=1 Tax=Paramacrobiotus metropolitanus TaxID=2943436 RepID=UPI002445F589|nr:uncharacterized protein LOC129602581 [Paramacrobiotus metropolitanus]
MSVPPLSRCKSAQELRSLQCKSPSVDVSNSLRRSESAYFVRDFPSHAVCDDVQEEKKATQRPPQKVKDVVEYWHAFIGVWPNGRTRRYEEVVLSAERFLKMYGIQGCCDISPQTRGFVASFRSRSAAELAINNAEDSKFDDALRRSAVARLVTLNRLPFIAEELEAEVWIYPKRYEPCADQVEELVKWWHQLQWCGEVDGKFQQQDDVWKMILKPFHVDQEEVKYVVKMRSSETAVVAAASASTSPLANCIRQLVIKASHASCYKHRFDTESLVIILPACAGVPFDENTLIAWSRPLENIIDFRRFNTKILEPNVWQLFTKYADERNLILRNIKMCGRYRNCPVSVVSWLEYLQYTKFKTVLTEAEQHRLKLLIEGNPEELQKIQQELAALNQKMIATVADDGTDSYYYDLAHCLLHRIDLIVNRFGNCMKNEKIQFFDLFITSVDYYQTALKRASTIHKFRDQLDDLVEIYRAAGGLILNTYLSLDQLNGVVFYLWFRDLNDLTRLRDDVKKRRVYLVDVIQPQRDMKVTTEALGGGGFSAYFRSGERRVILNLIEISKSVAWDFK